MADHFDYQYIAELVQRAQIGNSDAFAELYMATYQKQYRFASRYLRDDFLAQDALQETYILVYKRLSSLKDPKLFISWLNQICFRVCFRMQKQEAQRKTEGEESMATIADDSYDPESEAIRIDQGEYLIRQIMSLPSSESQAILLHYYDNMKITDIAEIMDISRSSVLRYLASGRSKLHKLLS